MTILCNSLFGGMQRVIKTEMPLFALLYSIPKMRNWEEAFK